MRLPAAGVVWGLSMIKPGGGPRAGFYGFILPVLALHGVNFSVLARARGR